MKNVLFALTALAILTGCDDSKDAFESRTVVVEECTPESDHQCMGIDYEKLREAAEKGEIKVPAAEAQ